MYQLVTPPAAEPLSLADVKAALRVGHDDDDTLLAGMIATARTFLERRLDRAFLRQTWQARVDGAPLAAIPLRPGPVVSVLSVTVTSASGIEEVLGTDDYSLCGSKPSELAISAPLASDVAAVTIVFEAGAASAADLPDDLLRAVYLLTAHYYEERELFRERRYVPVPLGVEALIEAYREVRL